VQFCGSNVLQVPRVGKLTLPPSFGAPSKNVPVAEGVSGNVVRAQNITDAVLS